MEVVPPAAAAARLRFRDETIPDDWIVVDEPLGELLVDERERTPRSLMNSNTITSHSGETLSRVRNRAPCHGCMSI